MKTLLITLLLTINVQAASLYDPQTGTYLGEVNSNRYDANSTSNPYGRYGSQYSADSINNPYGQYGSRYSNRSPNNPYATNPPVQSPTFNQLDRY